LPIDESSVSNVGYFAILTLDDERATESNLNMFEEGLSIQQLASCQLSLLEDIYHVLDLMI